MTHLVDIFLYFTSKKIYINIPHFVQIPILYTFTYQKNVFCDPSLHVLNIVTSHLSFDGIVLIPNVQIDVVLVPVYFRQCHGTNLYFQIPHHCVYEYYFVSPIEAQKSSVKRD
jgi:hypothetical protein